MRATTVDKVRALLSRGDWLSVFDIAERLGISQTNASARIRDLRKARFDSWDVRSYCAPGSRTWFYRIDPEQLRARAGSAKVARGAVEHRLRVVSEERTPEVRAQAGQLELGVR